MLIEVLVLVGIVAVGFDAWLALDYRFPSYDERNRLW